MSEAIHDNSFIQPPPTERQERTLVAVPTEQRLALMQHGFDVKSFIDYIEHHPLSSVSVLSKLLEQVGALPGDLEPVDADLRMRHNFFDRISKAKEIFDTEYIDSESPIGINRERIGSLYDKTEQYDASPELVAFDSLSHRVSNMQNLQSIKPLVNEAEYLYRIFLSGEAE